MSYGRLIIKADLGYSITDADVVNPTYDVCQSSYPIFKCTSLSDANCIKHAVFDLTGLFGAVSGSTFIDHVWVFKFMYFVVNDSSSTQRAHIYRIEGNPRESGT